MTLRGATASTCMLPCDLSALRAVKCSHNYLLGTSRATALPNRHLAPSVHVAAGFFFLSRINRRFSRCLT